MSRKALFETGAALCTVGAAIFAVGASREAVSRLVHLPDWAFGASTALGVTLALIGALLFGWSFLVEGISHAVSQAIYGDLESRYLCSYAGPSDLAGLHSLYERYFGEDTPDIGLMNSWVAKYPSAFAVVHRVTQQGGLLTRHELVGSFKLLPLTAKGQRALELGQTTGSGFRPEHISTGRSRVTAYYVGDVVGTTRFTRGIVMAHLSAAVSSMIRGAASIYARPLTKDGLRIMTKHGFVQVSDRRSAPQIGRICTLDVASMALVRKRKPRRLRPVPPDKYAAVALAAG
jgi:hypothetical protein